MMKMWEKNINKSIASLIDTPYEECGLYERFKFVKDIMLKRVHGAGDLLDIGCSKGEFIWYLKDFLPDMRYTGIDISSTLISLAKKEPKLKDVTFIRTDAQNFDLKRKFDIVLMNGLLAIFDDYKRSLEQMARCLKPEGWGYIFECFTEDDIDVLVRYRNNYAGSKEWESGFNMFSLNTIKETLKAYSNDVRFYKFNLSIDLPKKKDPVRAYTLNTVEEGKIILNRANIVNRFYFVEFRKKGKN